MTDSGMDIPFLIMIVGGLVVLSIMIRAGMDKLGLPPLVGYLALGFIFKIVNVRFEMIPPSSLSLLDFFANLGLVALLFKIGLESNLKSLLDQLSRASLVWISNVLISGLIGFVSAFYVLNFALVTSIILATAFTATSVGISLATWSEADALNSTEGALLLDVAELDDISAVILMGLLFSVLPIMKQGFSPDIWPILGRASLFFLLKMVLFGAVCLLFSMYAEQPLTDFFRRAEKPPAPMILVVGVGLIIASLAGILGFSLAIGSFFAGIVFSRDPKTVKMEASFLPIYDLFSPFFFIGIGLGLELESMGAAMGLGMALTLAAVLSKLLANGIPVGIMSGLHGAILIGVSMVPRAEITMVIISKSRELGDWAVPPEIYGAMVVVSALTCLVSPPSVKALIKKWPRAKDG